MAKRSRWSKPPDPVLWHCLAPGCGKIAPFKDGTATWCFEHWLESPHGQELMLTRLNKVNADD